MKSTGLPSEQNRSYLIDSINKYKPKQIELVAELCGVTSLDNANQFQLESILADLRFRFGWK